MLRETMITGITSTIEQFVSNDVRDLHENAIAMFRAGEITTKEELSKFLDMTLEKVIFEFVVTKKNFELDL